MLKANLIFRMYKKYYSKFLKANEGIQHYACHSHHYWPDVTYEAMIEYWNDSARLVDDKWNYILGTKVPQTQKLIADILNLNHPENICFASNTHELILRLLSTFQKKIKILTTDSEFYSFSRQIHRLAELNLIELTVVSASPDNNFSERLIKEIEKNDFDMIFFSQVFFNSGLVVKNLEDIVEAIRNPETLIVIDGYHGFMAIPTDLSEIQDRVFYMAGSYKYAQGGEGCCFMTIPKGFNKNPAITGWYAGFQDLENNSTAVTFNPDGSRFAGSTLDYTALYRLHAVLNLFKEQGLTVLEMHLYVQKLQNAFLNEIEKLNHPHLNRKNLILEDEQNHGHFFSFKLPDVEICNRLKKELRECNVITDSRKNILRFGFGIYQDEIDFSSFDT